MILLALALQAAPAPADEVLVIGRKLATWRAHLSTGGGRLRCVTRRSSGDPEIDAIGCDAMTGCWPEARPRFEATRAKGLDRAERKRLMTAAEQAFGACMSARRNAGIDALAARRGGGA